MINIMIFFLAQLIYMIVYVIYLEMKGDTVKSQSLAGWFLLLIVGELAFFFFFLSNKIIDL